MIQDAPYAERWSSREFFRAKTGLELGGKQGREREAVPPRLPSGWAAGLDLDRLRCVVQEPEGTTASGWNDAEVRLPDFCTLPPFHVSASFEVTGRQRFTKTGSYLLLLGRAV